MHTLLSLMLGFTFGPRLAALIILAGDILALSTIPSVLMRRRGRPLSALSWVLALLTFPFGGALAWWLLGRIHLQRQTSARRQATARLCALCPEPARTPAELPAPMRAIVPFALEGRRWSDGAFPPAAASVLRILRDGAEAFPAMEAAVAEARREIRALFYVWEADATGCRLAERLCDKARQGVRVRILVDAVGSRAFLRRPARSLRESGAQVAPFLPPRYRPWAPTFNFRNHRKLLLVDGRVAFTGGMNIGVEYERDWHDVALELQGPVTTQLDEVFQEDWVFATGEHAGPIEPRRENGDEHPVGLCAVVASGPDRAHNRVHDGFFLALAQAQRRIWLATPYFVPSAPILAALRAAALRGVDVRVMTTLRSDVPLVTWASRSYYPDLVDAGVRVFEYQPRFSHSKLLVVDDGLAVLGSPNTDIRSFRLNFELACFVFSRKTNEEVAAIFTEDLAQSQEVRAADISAKPRRVALVESAAHLLSPLL